MVGNSFSVCAVAECYQRSKKWKPSASFRSNSMKETGDQRGASTSEVSQSTYTVFRYFLFDMWPYCNTDLVFDVFSVKSHMFQDPGWGTWGWFYNYFLVTGSLGDDFIWFLTSQRRFSVFWQIFVLIFLHGEISLLSLHPWIPLIHINIFKNRFSEIWRSLKKLQIIEKDFCKLFSLKPRIFDLKSDPGFELPVFL